MSIEIHGKQYVTVAERLALVHESKTSFEMVESEPYEIAGRILWRVTILVDGKSYKGNAEVKLTAKSGPDASSPFECAETSAMGRALGFAGYGAIEVASADEVVRAQAVEPTPLPTAKEMYRAGREQGLWADAAGFYQFCADTLQIEVGAATTLSVAQRSQLQATIERALSQAA
jgi:hypothetical protein